MLCLLLVILLNTLIFTEFKLFTPFRINALQAITVNYWTCLITGILTHGYSPFTSSIVHENWFTSAVLLGTYFIFLFNFMSYSTTTQGMTATTIANKLSLVIPVVIFYFLYNEDMGWMKLTGIALAIPAVYLATKQNSDIDLKHLLVPAGIFICSGLSDTAIKYIQHTQLGSDDAQSAFTITTFTIAAILGTLIVALRLSTGKDKFAGRNIIAGVLLGIPNYFSIYYLIRLFDSGIMQSSSIIPVNNIGIVVTTTLVAIFLFKEKAGKRRVAGIILSILSIILIALSGN